MNLLYKPEMLYIPALYYNGAYEPAIQAGDKKVKDETWASRSDTYAHVQLKSAI